MPITPTYPGVYIEEIPSGVRTITGVATSITAFIGRALRGPTDEDGPVTINSYGDFERIFGGLWVKSTLGYAVRDFYLNGGNQAIIVRLYHPDSGQPDADPPVPAPADKTKLSVGGLSLVARYPGSWGENLRASVDKKVSKDVAESMGLTQDKLFNLTVRDASPGGQVEQFRNLTLEDSVRRIDKVLKAESKLVLWDGETWPPDPLPTIAEDEDAVTKAEKKLAAAKRAVPQVPEDITAAENELKAAKAALKTSDGLSLTQQDDFTPEGAEGTKTGLYALEKADLFNLLCIPPYLPVGDTADVDPSLISTAAAYCESRRAMLLIDPPSTWNDKDDARDGVETGVGDVSKNAALFFPRLRQPNPLRDNQMEDFAPCGAVAGIFARTDTQRGVWKAPAGLEATLVGVPQLSVPLTDAENGELNPKGVNCLRAMPAAGRVVWGARTRVGDDRLASEWKYIPVRRLALFIEESLYRGTQWVVFEPNDEPLWAQIRLNVGAFMHNLFRQGAFQGRTPREAYFVKCDKETTTQNDINLGIVNIVVGFAPLKPAEFVIIKLQQMAGQIEV
jgi:phage tail sheath protein FI